MSVLQYNFHSVFHSTCRRVFVSQHKESGKIGNSQLFYLNQEQTLEQQKYAAEIPLSIKKDFSRLIAVQLRNTLCSFLRHAFLFLISSGILLIFLALVPVERAH